MKAPLLCTVLTAALCLSLSAGVLASSVDEGYQDVMTTYFNVPASVVDDVANAGLSSEEIPVALYISQKTGVPPMRLAETRADGHSWQGISSVRGMKPADFYVMICAKVESDTYGPLLQTLKTPAAQSWNRTPLTDQQIVNLVNLKMISSGHDYSIFEVMDLRDDGQDFVQVNREIEQRKDQLVQAQQEKQRQPIKAGMGGF